MFHTSLHSFVHKINLGNEKCSKGKCRKVWLVFGMLSLWAVRVPFIVTLNQYSGYALNMLVTFISGSQNSKEVEYSVSNSALYMKIWGNINKMDGIDIKLKKQSLSSGAYPMESF